MLGVGEWGVHYEGKREREWERKKPVKMSRHSRMRSTFCWALVKSRKM
jgi:hypothetical protein